MLIFDLSGLEHEMMDLRPDTTLKFLKGGSSGNVLKTLMTSSLCYGINSLISVMIDINADEPVFRRAAQACKDGEMVEVAFIESVGNNVWSRVIQVEGQY